MKRKGQSAIEYLVTYGWMLTALAIVSGALYGSGYMNFCSESTTGMDIQSLQVGDFGVSTNEELQMVLENRDGQAFEHFVKEIEIEDRTTEEQIIVSPEETIPAGTQERIDIDNFRETNGCNDFEIQIRYDRGDLLTNQYSAGTMQASMEITEETTEEWTPSEQFIITVDEEPEDYEEGETTELSYTVTNEGEEEGTDEITTEIQQPDDTTDTLYNEEETLNTEDDEITQTHNLDYETTGTYTYTIETNEDTETGSFTVTEDEEEEEEEPEAGEIEIESIETPVIEEENTEITLSTGEDIDEDLEIIYGGEVQETISNYQGEETITWESPEFYNEDNYGSQEDLTLELVDSQNSDTEQNLIVYWNEDEITESNIDEEIYAAQTFNVQNEDLWSSSIEDSLEDVSLEEETNIGGSINANQQVSLVEGSTTEGMITAEEILIQDSTFREDLTANTITIEGDSTLEGSIDTETLNLGNELDLNLDTITASETIESGTGNTFNTELVQADNSITMDADTTLNEGEINTETLHLNGDDITIFAEVNVNQIHCNGDNIEINGEPCEEHENAVQPDPQIENFEIEQTDIQGNDEFYDVDWAGSDDAEELREVEVLIYDDSDNIVDARSEEFDPTSDFEQGTFEDMEADDADHPNQGYDPEIELIFRAGDEEDPETVSETQTAE